jgi:hypothetical protein
MRRGNPWANITVCLCVELQSHEDSRTSSVNFSVNSSAIPYCPSGKSVPKTQISAARRGLDWPAASVRLLFDGDTAVLHNTVGTSSRRGHSSLPASAARVLRGRTLNPSAWGHLNPSSYCDVGRLFYGVFKLWSKLQRKK